VIAYVIGIVVVALVFDFINGFHDSANSIATIVGTRVLTPFKAVLWAATFNFAALFFSTMAVAKAISSGYVDQNAISANVIAAALLGAIIWNLITWWFGIPSSSSHALIGGFAGAAVGSKGFGALKWGPKWIETLSAIAISPALGALLGMALMVIVYRLFATQSPGKVDKFFRPAQLASSALLSLAHGGNDAQKTMGIIVGLLAAPSVRKLFEPYTTGVLSHFYVPDTSTIPLWVEIAAYFAISLGTLFGGWRIVHTMGTRITKLRPVGGFCAETGGALVIFLASHFGIPVSTTHTITGSIVGVGAANRVRAVRWGLAGNIVWAWVVTIPASALLAALSALILNFLVVAGRP
jgi:inorganic phosphate transporter, PiT family